MSYSDTTPTVSYTYDRLGRPVTVVDAAGTRTFAYADGATGTLQPLTESFSGGLFDGTVLTQVYEDGTGGTVAGRWGGVQVGSSGDPDADYAATYTYDAYGRLEHVAGPGLPAGGAEYAYTAAGLLERLRFKDGGGTVRVWTAWGYEADRDVVTHVVNSFGDEQTFDTVSAYGYGYDALGRRTHKANVGAAFSAAHFDVYGYNGRSELTAADRWTGTGPDDANKQDVAGDYGYAYDPIGNRLSYDPAGANTVYYCANNLNQYTTTDDAATCPPSTPAQSFAYDEDGNLVYEEGGGLAAPRAYVYDAENRLIQVGPAGSPAVAARSGTAD